jgi:acetolactate synthase-1/2/3 large subunit
MRVCDWIAKYVYDLGIKRIHGLTGGGAMGLNDGFIKHPDLKYIAYHHEQGAGHAAIGESKFTGLPSVVNPTTGCGGTNCITSVLDAWQDSVPVVFISGNVKLDNCSRWVNGIKKTNIRKLGVQEHDIIKTVESITKKAFFVSSVYSVAEVLEEAFYIATQGRPGPVWVDIPADIQTQLMPDGYLHFNPPQTESYSFTNKNDITEILKNSKRPIVLAGYGIRQSNTVSEFVRFIETFNIPYVSTYGARDYLPFDHHLNIGTVGIKGSRSGNFALQNADVMLVLGSSLGTSVTGYDVNQFNSKCNKIVVDVDLDELNKDIILIDYKINCDLKTFFMEMLCSDQNG